MSIGENMRQAREECGYSLKQVEERTGINNGNLSRYERNLNFPSIECCIKLAYVYGITIDELIGRNGIAQITVHSSPASQLSKDEKKLLDNFRTMRPDLQAMILKMSDTFTQTPESIEGTSQKKKA
jgi:transcriptional regulator with XRE-family HTH domain